MQAAICACERNSLWQWFDMHMQICTIAEELRRNGEQILLDILWRLHVDL